MLFSNVGRRKTNLHLPTSRCYTETNVLEQVEFVEYSLLFAASYKSKLLSLLENTLNNRQMSTLNPIPEG